MAPTRDLRGVFTALVTPFDSDGRLHLAAMPSLLEFQKAAGVDGIVVCGTNGEGPSLQVAERMAVLETALGCSTGLPIIAATGAASIEDTLALTRHAVDAGCDGLLVLPPFFFTCADDAGLAASFRRIAEAASLPIILYSIPQFSGIAIGPQVLRLLEDIPHIIGVKESSGKIQASLDLLAKCPGHHLYIGSDDLAAQLLQAGAAGIISGTANAFPELLVGVWRAFQSGDDLDGAQARLDAAIRVILDYPIVANMKAVLAARGVADLSVRLPLLPMDSERRDEMLARLRTKGCLLA
jgi:4-hydroxy-tetrahydrodipicolinate synthase